METNVGRIQQFAVMEIAGALRDDEADVFKKEALDVLAEGHKHLLVDFSNTSSLNSQAVSSVVSVWKELVERNGNLVIVTGPGHVRAVFESSHLGTIIDLFGSRAEFEKNVLNRPENASRSKWREEAGFLVLEAADSFGVVLEAKPLDEALAQAFADDKSRLAVDMSGVRHMNSSAMGTVIKWNKKLAQAGGDFRLLKVEADLFYCLDLAGVNKAVHITNQL